MGRVRQLAAALGLHAQAWPAPISRSGISTENLCVGVSLFASLSFPPNTRLCCLLESRYRGPAAPCGVLPLSGKITLRYGCTAVSSHSRAGGEPGI